MDKSTVPVEGLAALRRRFRVYVPELDAAIHEGLKEIVSQVAQTAREVAAFQGFAAPGRSGRGTGELIGSIRSGVTKGGKGYVAVRARSTTGFSYPRYWEYVRQGERAFLHPAIDLNRDRIYLSLVAVVSAVNKRFNEGGL